MGIRRFVPAATLLALAALAAGPRAPASEDPPETLLLQDPAVSTDSVAFVFAEDLWIVGREGGVARRLTSSRGGEVRPRFSPDGKWIAFTGEYEGNQDVYVIPVTGGIPKRLTWHPGPDVVCGWHPDGKRILFLSPRDCGAPTLRPWTVAVDGGMPEPTDLPKASDASFAPDGRRIAYTPLRDAVRTWKRYRGGRTSPVWIYDPATRGIEQAPHVNATDADPCWAGDAVFFRSDRDGIMDVFRWKPGSAAAAPVTRFKDYGVRNMSSGPGAVAFERAGAIHLLDPASGQVKRLRISVLDDGLASNPRWEKVSDSLRDADPAPNGKRAVIEARGEIFTAPREHGDPRNLTNSPAAHDRSPAWSPDGEKVAWFSDAGGEYRLMVGDSLGREPPMGYSPGGAPFYWAPRWSPDGKRILFTDKGNRIAFVTLESGEVTEVSKAQGDLGSFEPTATWSPDSRWIAFEQRNPDTMYDRVALFEVATGKTTPVTDGFAAAFSPAFSRDGTLLFFAATVEIGPSLFDLDLSANNGRRHEENLYLAVLKKDGKNPFAPKSDEGTGPKDEKKDGKKPGRKEPGKDEPKKEAERKEEPKEAPKDLPKDAPREERRDEGLVAGKETKPATEAPEAKPAEKKEEKPTAEKPSIDLEGLDQRILALPDAKGDFRALRGGKDRLLLLDRRPDGRTDLRAYDLDARKLDTLHERVDDVRVSADGDSVLFRRGREVFLGDHRAGNPKRLDLDGIRVRVEPAREWPQILREAWRIQRDWFYDPNMHGVDWNAMWDRWSVFLPHVRCRADLRTLTGEMMGELCCGHEYLWGGEEEPGPQGVGTGLLGADWEAAEGKYRLRRIYRGQNWNPGLRAPLTEPGVDAREGDFLVSVNGRPVAMPENLYAAFEGTAGKQVEMVLSAKADGSDPRKSVVVPVPEEGQLRRLAWVEDCRRRVDRLSGGRLAYIYMPDTGDRGLDAFDRDFYSQIDREGVILDERYNGGGKVADYVVQMLSRRVLCWWRNREGWVGRTPWGTIQGPKVMVINESAGSGGDAMPWLFRQEKVGTLVGTRTWGGLVGISGYPTLMDGGGVTAATFGILDPSGKWVVENEGVAPDVEVVETPKDWLEGRDPQLEKAVEIAMKALETFRPVPKPGTTPPAKR